MNLILKTKHRRMTWGSALAILPAVFTVAAYALVRLGDVQLAHSALGFILGLPDIALFGLWLVLPVFSYVTASKAERYGTIHRLRNVNAWTRRLASAILLLITLTATASFF
jgi:hypothetical protein